MRKGEAIMCVMAYKLTICITCDFKPINPDPCKNCTFLIYNMLGVIRLISLFCISGLPLFAAVSNSEFEVLGGSFLFAGSGHLLVSGMTVSLGLNVASV